MIGRAGIGRCVLVLHLMIGRAGFGRGAGGDIVIGEDGRCGLVLRSMIGRAGFGRCGLVLCSMIGREDSVVFVVGGECLDGRGRASGN